MEVLVHTASQMVVLFIIMFLGGVARKTRLMNDAFDAKLSTLVMQYALPAMLLSSVLNNTNLPDTDTVLSVLVYSTVIYLVTCTLAYLIVRFCYRGVPRAAKGAHAFLISFSNTGFIGFALLNAIFGPDAVLYGAIYNIPYNFFLFSVGMLFVSRTGSSAKKAQGFKENARIIVKSLITPAMISCIIAMFLAIFHITDDGIIGTTCELLGNLTIPGAMLLVGSTIAKMPVKHMLTDKWSYVTTALRLICVPLLVFFIGGLFIQDRYLLAIIVLISATPAASISTMMAITYEGDTLTMARGTFLTTVVSLVTLPLIALIVV
jgi:hypothetical protein